MASQSTAKSGGIGFFGLLTLIFITLKLCGVIHWSWWWVTLPLWGPLMIVVAVLLILFVLSIIASLLPDRKRSR